MLKGSSLAETFVMLIYAIKNQLFIHSETIIHQGHVAIYNKNKQVGRYEIKDTEFFTRLLELVPDFYHVRVYNKKIKIDEKRVFISKAKKQKIQR